MEALFTRQFYPSRLGFCRLTGNMEMSKRNDPFIERIGNWVGRFLSNFSFVLVTLLGYLILSLGTYLWIAIDLGYFVGKPVNIAYKVATGSDPLEYVGDLHQFWFLWAWILVFHVISWLVVPVLAATAVDAAYRVVEERKTRAERNLRTKLAAIGRKRGFSGLELDNFIEETLESFRLRLKGR